MEDYTGSSTYSCLVRNDIVRAFVVGDDVKIEPTGGRSRRQMYRVL
jgi:hypothetical protein